MTKPKSHKYTEFCNHPRLADKACVPDSCRVLEGKTKKSYNLEALHLGRKRSK